MFGLGKIKEMSEKSFLDRIKKTLMEKTERFVSGREVRKEHQYFALRHNGPPLLPRINVQSFDILNNDFLEKELKLRLYKPLAVASTTATSTPSQQKG